MMDWLETLLETEARYFSGMAMVERRDYAWFLTNPELRDYRNVNCALHLRDDGRGPQAVAREVVAFYRSRGLTPTADVDAVAERQGIGAALRRLGVTPVRDAILYMVYSHPEPQALPDLPSRPPHIDAFSSLGETSPPTPLLDARASAGDKPSAEERLEVSAGDKPLPYREGRLPSLSTSPGNRKSALHDFSPLSPRSREPEEGPEVRYKIQEWIDLVASEEAGTEYEDFWREIVTREAQAEGRNLYLARLDGQPVGACQLFLANAWGRIDDVYVRPEFRRRGIASALIIRVVADALTRGCRETYLFTEAGGMAEPLYRKLGFEVRAVNALRRHIAS